MATACSSPQGEVTGKSYTPDRSGIEYTVECGIAIDGSFDCGKLKLKYMTRPERFTLHTTDGSVRVGRGTYESCEVGDWYDGDRCLDERPVE